MDNNKDSFRESLIPKNNEYLKQKKFFEDSIMSALDIYSDKHSFETKEYMHYLFSAIYITYNEMYKDFVLKIPFRSKSENSFIKNISKEFSKNLDNISTKAKEQNKKIDTDFIKENFTTNNLTLDINAATIVLKHFKDDIAFLYGKNTPYKTPEIDKLVEEKEDNRSFFINTKKIIDPTMTGKIYLKTKIELLKRIINLCYPGCNNELADFQEELKKTEKELDNDNIPGTYNDLKNNIDKQSIELNELLDELRYRLEDKLQYTILKTTIENVLSAPLIKDTLHVTYDFIKNTEKENGYVATYYVLRTPFGDIELQLQSEERYWQAKKGLASHSSIIGKALDLYSFFEYVNPEKETIPLETFLDSIDKDTEILNMNEEELKESNENVKRIKIKDNMEYSYSKPIDNSQERKKATIDTDEYLLQFVLLNSPCLNICTSGPGESRLNTSIQHINLENEFKEIIRKRDSNTVLGNLLTERLHQILKNPKKENIRVKSKNDTIIKLPTNIGKNNIIKYGNNLGQNIDYSNKFNKSDTPTQEL